MVFEFSMIETIGFAVVMLLLGMWLKRRIYFFERFAIPSPVIGGFLFAIVNLILRQTGLLELEFDTTLQSFFMTMFFTSIGYGASIQVLKAAGPKVLKFLGLATLLVFLQSLVAVLLAPVVQIPAALALMTGSVAMTGGHGTAGGIAPLIEASGVSGAETVAYTAATFGLVAGSLMGGPVANRIIRKFKLEGQEAEDVEVDESILAVTARKLRRDRIMQAFVMLLIAMFIGSFITDALNYFVGMVTDRAAFPGYLGSMLTAVYLRYLSDKYTKTEYKELVPVEEVDVIGNVSLSLFLAMALMTVRLWELADLAIPLFILLGAQVILMYLYANFVTFRFMGKNYDAAVLTGGHCGFGMGATPNGVANMESIVQKYKESKMAFFVLPIVGGMFIDFTNILIIMGFLTVV